MTSTPVSVRRQAPDIINKPVVFPFDETTEEPDDVFNVPKSKTPEAHKPNVGDTAEAGEASEAAAASASAKTGASSELETGLKNTPDKAASPPTSKKPHKAVIIVVDVLIIIAVIIAVCLVIRIFAPESGAGELINKGINTLMQVTGISDNESSAAANDGDRSSSDSGYIMPISDGDTLISSQLYSNYNIKEVKYDPSASWKEGVRYAIEGAAAAKPLGDDHWKDGAQGPLLYDESAVAAVIKFDSGLTEYINKENMDFFDTIAVGSAVERKVSEYADSVSQLSIDALGIGNIRKNGDDLYVWANETVTESRDGVPVQRSLKRLYMLTPDVDTYKVSDFEDLA
jgi:hypothetical protein